LTIWAHLPLMRLGHRERTRHHPDVYSLALSQKRLGGLGTAQDRARLIICSD
jgi:hypothetical protein